MGDTTTADRDLTPLGSRWRAVGRHLAYGLGLVPASAGELVAVAVSGPAGGVDAARRHLACRGTPWPGAGRVDGPRVVVHGLVGVVVGLVWWWLAWMALLAVARGPFYGLVVPGPYDDAWGGPGLAGAWAVHAGVGVVSVLVIAVLGEALGALYVRLTEHLLGGRRRAWVVPVTVLVVGGASVLVAAWVRQI
ncbi:hypothetical protein GCM10023200_19880 [Actinomycetospora chlora]|uniref:Uncharacterized protein n=1 Tax=Actinomycetospora chlora TaxID=663608 RepID=A0ABP9ATC9_9PSEU